MTTIGTRIRQERKRLGLTQVELSERSTLSRQTIIRSESGEHDVTLSSLLLLQRVGFDLHYITTGEHSQQPADLCILNQLAADFTGSNFSELCSKYPFLMQEVLILLQAHRILTRQPLAQPQPATPADTESPAALIWEGDQASLASLHGFAALIRACQGAMLTSHRAVFRLTVSSKSPTPIMLASNSLVGIPRNGGVLPPVLPVPAAPAPVGECTHPIPSAPHADS